MQTFLKSVIYLTNTVIFFLFSYLLQKSSSSISSNSNSSSNGTHLATATTETKSNNISLLAIVGDSSRKSSSSAATAAVTSSWNQQQQQLQQQKSSSRLFEQPVLYGKNKYQGVGVNGAAAVVVGDDEDYDDEVGDVDDSNETRGRGPTTITGTAMRTPTHHQQQQQQSRQPAANMESFRQYNQHLPALSASISDAAYNNQNNDMR